MYMSLTSLRTSHFIKCVFSDPSNVHVTYHSLPTTPPGVLDYFAGVRARVAPRRVLFAFEQGPKTKLSAAERALLRQLCLSVGLRSGGGGGGGGAAPTDNLAESYLTGEEPEVRCDTM